MEILVVAFVSLKVISAEAVEDSDLTTPEIIQKYGYPAETHEVTTDDGYVLTLHRIPYGRCKENCKINSASCGNRTIPTLLQHGILFSSAGWVTSGTKSLPFVLADAGYDVWMGNARGNRYSTKHTNLHVEDIAFWDFSWHEIGIIDTRNTIDYILNVTREPDLNYIGHSQGTTAFWLHNIYNPKDAEKVRAMFAFAPVAYLCNTESPVIKTVSEMEQLGTYASEIFGYKNFSPGDKFVNEIAAKFCRYTQPAFPELCSNILFLTIGVDSVQINKTELPTILGHTPAGASTKQILHYGQHVKDCRFAHYDHGPFENLRVYGTATPPKYELKNVTAPVYIYHGLNDKFTAMEDLQRLINELPNIRKIYQISFEKYSHGDFMWAMDNYELLYKELLKDLAESCTI